MRLNPAALRVIRELSGYSATQLARFAEIERSTLSRLEAGTRGGTPGQITALAKVLNVPVAAITDGPAT